MKRTALVLSFLIGTAPLALMAQSFVSHNLVAEESSLSGAGVKSAAAAKAAAVDLRPFSRVAVSGGISLMGVNMQVATNINRHMNLRGTGNFFNYTVDNIETNGFDVTGKINFATGGASLDYYPFPRHGFRLSPGVMLYNQNNISAGGIVASGKDITLDNKDYYSASSTSGIGATPINVTANLGLNTRKQAFTMTTGWGNMISRKGGHWSFPFEIGAAFVGTPSLDMHLSGWACDDPQLTQCADLASTDADISKDVKDHLDAQIAKWKSDLDPLKVYPILSFGVSYNLRIR